MAGSSVGFGHQCTSTWTLLWLGLLKAWQFRSEKEHPRKRMSRNPVKQKNLLGVSFRSLAASTAKALARFKVGSQVIDSTSQWGE
jgi:hypothetical protein